MPENENYLTLKWGTLKSFDFEGNEEAAKLLKSYFQIGHKGSAMTHIDSARQKEILCDLIDLVPKKIFLEWDGIYLTKEKAKRYVMEYRKED